MRILYAGAWFGQSARLKTSSTSGKARPGNHRRKPKGQPGRPECLVHRVEPGHPEEPAYITAARILAKYVASLSHAVRMLDCDHVEGRAYAGMVRRC